MIEVVCNDRLGKKVWVVSIKSYSLYFLCTLSISRSENVDFEERGGQGVLQAQVVLDATMPQVRVKCNPDDTIGDLKKLIAAQTGTKADKIRLRES